MTKHYLWRNKKWAFVLEEKTNLGKSFCLHGRIKNSGETAKKFGEKNVTYVIYFSRQRTMIAKINFKFSVAKQ